MGWKRAERVVAKRLGGERVGNRGMASEDVHHPWLSIEVKTRKSLPAWLVGAVERAEHDCEGEDDLPAVVLVQDDDDLNDLIVLRLADFERTFVEDCDNWLTSEHERYPDVSEIVLRRSLPAWLVGAVEQAERNCPDGGHVPVVVLHRVGERYDNDLIILRFTEFERYFVGGG